MKEKAIELLEKAELKSDDFKDEVTYKTVVNNFAELLNKLELQENYNDMLVAELNELKAENDRMQEHLMHNESELIQLRKENEQNVWIDVNKRVDIKGGKYLVFDPNWIEDNKIRTAFYRNYNGIWIADNGSDDVIHPTFYMKLPNDPNNT